MRMTREQMDQLINQHFGFEANDDVEGVLGSLADEVRHEVIPSPMGEQTDKAGIRAFYKMLFADLRGEGVTPLRRFYGEDFVIDETLWHGRVVDGRPFPAAWRERQGELPTAACLRSEGREDLERAGVVRSRRVAASVEC